MSEQTPPWHLQTPEREYAPEFSNRGDHKFPVNIPPRYRWQALTEELIETSNKIHAQNERLRAALKAACEDPYALWNGNHPQQAMIEAALAELQ